MTKLHPLFAEILKPMTYLNDAPDRAIQPPHNSEVEQPRFDEWDTDLMEDICGKRLSGPVQDLLIAYSQFQATRDSFGVDAEKFVQFIAPMLKQLKEACIDEWRDQ